MNNIQQFVQIFNSTAEAEKWFDENCAHCTKQFVLNHFPRNGEIISAVQSKRYCHLQQIIDSSFISCQVTEDELAQLDHTSDLFGIILSPCKERIPT